MDIGKFDFDGTWVEIAVRSEKALEPFRFKVQPLGFAESAAAFGGKALDTMLKLFISAVVGWDLVADGKELPCDEATKARYLSRFGTYMVKSVNGVSLMKVVDGKEVWENQSLAGAVIEFCGQPDNFLKN